jgi:beta-lactamase regulating signal transducer with metallopeptidase domain
MTAIIEPLNAVAAVWTDRMWIVVWQSAILAAAVALIASLFLRRVPPSIRYWVWQVLALKLLLMPFWTFAIPMPPVIATYRVLSTPEPENAPLAKSTEPADAPTATLAPADYTDGVSNLKPPVAAVSLPRVTWQSWLLVAWVAVVIAQIGRLLWQRQRLRRLLREAKPADSALTTLVTELTRQIGLVKAPRVVLAAVDCSPFACGVFDAVLVIPARLAPTLTQIELRHVVLHELAHVRRRDLAWGWISELARIAYFFHPVVHWIAYRARLERELACDQLAMANSGNDAREYAATLVRVVSHSSEPSVFKTAAVSAGLDGGTP